AAESRARHVLARTRRIVLEGHALEVPRALECPHLGVALHMNPRVGFDSRHEILRHRVRERATAHHEPHGTSLLREVERRLPRGVPATYNQHFAAAAYPR